MMGTRALISSMSLFSRSRLIFSALFRSSRDELKKSIFPDEAKLHWNGRHLSLVQGVPEKMHFQNATERPQDKNGRTDPRAHSEIPIIMTTEGF